MGPVLESVYVIMHTCAALLFLCMGVTSLLKRYTRTLRSRARRSTRLHRAHLPTAKPPEVAQPIPVRRRTRRSRGTRSTAVENPVPEVALPTDHAAQADCRRTRRSRGARNTAVETPVPEPAPEVAPPINHAAVEHPTPEPAVDLCCVCLDEPRNVLLPCRHLCTCVGCSKLLLRSPDPKCPVCRTPFHRFTKVFFC